MLWHKTEFYPTSLQSVEDTNLVYISLPKVKMGEGNLTAPVKKTKCPHHLLPPAILRRYSLWALFKPTEKQEKELQGHK